MSGKALVLGAVLGLMACFAVAAGEGTAGRQERGEEAEEQAIIVQIEFLAEMWLEPGGEKARKYYSDLMGRWEACATRQSLPVLEAFITKAAEFKKPEGYGPRVQLPWGIFGTLDERIQKLWWGLKAEGMAPKEKAEKALSALGPTPSVPFDNGNAVKWLAEIGQPARQIVYAFLDGPPDGEWYDMPIGLLYSLLVNTPGSNVFRPSAQELQRFLKAPGTLGYFDAVMYLTEWEDDPDRALPHVLDLLSTTTRTSLGFACRRTRHLKDYRAQVMPALVEVARRREIYAAGIWPQIPEEIEGRDMVFRCLADLGEDPRSVEVFRDYVRNVSRPEAWLGLSKDALAAQQRALDAAYSALKKWGKLPGTEEQAP